MLKMSRLGRLACHTVLLMLAFQTGMIVDHKSCCSDEPPHIVVVVGTTHYSPEVSMPLFTKELERLGFRTTLVMGEGDPEKKTKDVLPGIEALSQADLAIFYMRFLQLPDAEFAPIEAYLKSGKPIIGLRTSNHAFKYPQGHKRIEWNDGFGRRALGTPYIAHQSSTTDVRGVEKYKNHPIIQNLEKSNWNSQGKLYLTRLGPGCVPLMVGTGTGRPRLLEKSFGVVSINKTESDVVAWTWQNEWGGKVFGTSFGHISDFGEPSFTRMLVNSVYWCLDQPIPKADVEIRTWKLKKPNKTPSTSRHK